MDNFNTNQSKDYWNSIGKSACPDDVVRDMSIDEIKKNINNDSNVLDLGCGNGYCTFEFAKTNLKMIIGSDYSEESIKQANLSKKYFSKDVNDKIDFIQADALDLVFEDHMFDKVISIRCLINVGDIKNQLKALREIYRVLKPGGLYLMCENTTLGLQKLNKLRTKIGLDEVKTRWHNTYIEEKLFFEEAEKYFKVKSIINFASTYYFLTRVIKPWNLKKNNEKIEYNDDFNVMSSKMPSFGEFSPMKLFILEKELY